MKRDAAKVVARMGGDAKDALPALIEALSMEDSSFAHATHTTIIKAIGSLGPDARSAVPTLMKLLDQSDSSVQMESRDRATIQALGQIGPAAEAALPMLLDHLNGQNALNRNTTLQAIARIGPNSSDVVAAFREILEDGPLLDEQLISAIETMGPKATEAPRAYTEEIFDHLANDGGFFRCKEAEGAVFFAPFEAQRRLEVLGGLVIPFLRAALNDERERVRVVSAYVLVDRGEDSSAVVRVLLAALDEPLYRGGAVGAFKKLGPSAQAALPALRSLAANAGDDSPFATMLHEAIQAIDADLREELPPWSQKKRDRRNFHGSTSSLRSCPSMPLHAMQLSTDRRFSPMDVQFSVVHGRHWGEGSQRHGTSPCCARLSFSELASDRVAVGRYRPTAPTDPYVPALEHTVPQIMASLRA